MMFTRRLAMIFRSKASKLLDRAEDPRESLDYSYEKQLQLLQQVRRGVADVATSRKRVEMQAEQLAASADRLERQATLAMASGREDLAREALTRRSAVQQQLTDLGREHAELRNQENQLTAATQRLQSKVNSFRTRKETIKATYAAAEAQNKIGEAFSGIGKEMGDVGRAVQRAQEKTTQLHARAVAIDELLASGALEDTSGTPTDDIQHELDQLSSRTDVELELTRIKRALSSGTTPSALEGSQSTPYTRTPATPATNETPAAPTAAEDEPR